MNPTKFPWEVDSDGHVYPEPSDAAASGEEADPHILRINPTRPEFEANKRLIENLHKLAVTLAQAHDEADYALGTEAPSRDLEIQTLRDIRRMAENALASAGITSDNLNMALSPRMRKE